MKAMTMVMRSMMVVVLSVFIFSCSDGEDGAIGPAGSQGEQGPAGQDGEDGVNGQDGEPGSSDVIYSSWIPSEFGDSVPEFKEFLIDVPDLTQEIIDKGTILVYARLIPDGISADRFFQLPIAFFGNPGESYYYITGSTGPLKIGVETTDGQDIGTPLLNGDYRYVLIPGGVPAGKSRLIEDYKNMSYEEIATLFNIPE